MITVPTVREDGRSIWGAMCTTPSWRPIGRAYFGVPVRSQYWMKATCQTGKWDIVNDWMNDWPMLKLPTAEWRHPGVPFSSERGESLRGMLDMLARGVAK